METEARSFGVADEHADPRALHGPPQGGDEEFRSRLDPHDTTIPPLPRPPNPNPTFSTRSSPTALGKGGFARLSRGGRTWKGRQGTWLTPHRQPIILVPFPPSQSIKNTQEPLIGPGSRTRPCLLVEWAMRRCTMSATAVGWFDKAWGCLNTRRVHERDGTPCALCLAKRFQDAGMGVGHDVSDRVCVCACTAERHSTS